MSREMYFDGNATERNINISGTLRVVLRYAISRLQVVIPHGVTFLSGIVFMSRSQNVFIRGSNDRLLRSWDKKTILLLADNFRLISYSFNFRILNNIR